MEATPCMNYFDSDTSNSTNMVVHIDEKGGTVIYIYVCGQGCTQFIRHRLAILSFSQPNLSRPRYIRLY